jgi:hypothetical protein
MERPDELAALTAAAQRLSRPRAAEDIVQRVVKPLAGA